MTRDLWWQNLTTYPFSKPMTWCLTARGCPHDCSYCNNCRYTEMYGRNKMRFRSVDNFLKEIKYNVDTFPSLELVGISDDDFMARPLKQIEEFAEKYKELIKIPFIIALSAKTYNDKKLEILIDAGLVGIQMGVQSGSQRVLDEVFNRNIPVKKTIEVVKKLEKRYYTNGLELYLDFITDNPFETQDDIIETYKYIVGLSHNTRLNIFALTFFPGTPIYERALKEGIVEPFGKTTFRSYRVRKVLFQQNYATFLIVLIRMLQLTVIRKYLPRKLLLSLASPFLRRVAKLFPDSFFLFQIRAVNYLIKRILRKRRRRKKQRKFNRSR
jgi:radical SAM superfamily enzyme YgiQ (UPF0313 family)